MNKQIEKFKKQLLEVTEVVNAFKSEAVQVKIIEKFLNIVVDAERGEAYDTGTNTHPNNYIRKTRSADESYSGGLR